MNIFIFLLLSAIGVGETSKILVVFPVPSRSHGILGNSVVKILLDAGHEVTLVSPLPAATSSSRLTYVNISSLTTILASQKSLNIVELSRSPPPVHAALHVGPVFAKKALEHPAVHALLRNTHVTFDAVLADYFFSGLLAPLAEIYDCPLIWYRTSDLCWQSLRVMHEASSPVYSSDLNVDRISSVPFSFGDRFYQLWTQFYVTGWLYYLKYQVEIPAYEELYGEPLRIRGKSLPDFDSLVYNASLMFVNSHPPLGQNLALPHNVKYIGGHHIDLESKPGSKNIKKIMDESKKGVIYFSMGTILKCQHMPDIVKRELIELFAQLDQTVIWKLEENITNLPRNIHIVKWAPQQSILNHSNALIFITHGGLGSLLEATHFGIPIIGIPAFGDQFANVNRAVARKVGVRVDYSDDFARKLEEAINEILGTPSYRENAKAASFQFRHRLVTPQQELAYWVQLIIDTKGAEHLRSPALQVSAPDRLYLDFLFLLVLILWFFAKVVKVIKLHLYSYDIEKKNA